MSRPTSKETLELCEYIVENYPEKEYDASKVAKWVSVRSSFSYAKVYNVIDRGIFDKYIFNNPVKVRTTKGTTLEDIQASKEEAWNDYTRIKAERAIRELKEKKTELKKEIRTYLAAKEKKRSRAALGVVKSRKDYEKGKFITLRTDEEIDAHYDKLAEQKAKTQPSKYGIIAALVLSCITLGVIFAVVL